MPPNPGPATPAPKAAPARRKSQAYTANKPGHGLYAITVGTESGHIVEIEKIDGETRHLLSAKERSSLAKANGGLPFRRLVKQVFAAGIGCVLGDPAEGESSESRQDSELNSLLLQSLIKGSRARELVEGEMFERSLIGALFSEGAAPSTH
jgi:hypothetical protein